MNFVLNIEIDLHSASFRRSQSNTLQVNWTYPGAYSVTFYYRETTNKVYFFEIFDNLFFFLFSLIICSRCHDAAPGLLVYFRYPGGPKRDWIYRFARPYTQSQRKSFDATRGPVIDNFSRYRGY